MDVESPFSVKRSLLQHADYYDAPDFAYERAGAGGAAPRGGPLESRWRRFQSLASILLLVLNTVLICVVVSSLRASPWSGQEEASEEAARAGAARVPPARADGAAAPEDAGAPSPAAPAGGAPPSDAAGEYVETMRAVMDATRDPCEHFYEYACGGWLEQDIPRSEEKISRHYQVRGAAPRAGPRAARGATPTVTEPPPFHLLSHALVIRAARWPSATTRC